MIDRKNVTNQRFSKDDDRNRETHDDGARIVFIGDRTDRDKLDSERMRSRRSESHRSDTILEFELGEKKKVCYDRKSIFFISCYCILHRILVYILIMIPVYIT